MKGSRAAKSGATQDGARRITQAPSQYGRSASNSGSCPIRVGDIHDAAPRASSNMWPKPVMSALFQGSRPTKPGTTYAVQNRISASLGRRRTASWATMAGVGWFTRRALSAGPKEQGQPRLPLRRAEEGVYFFVPKRLRNFVTRPAMLATEFSVPV